MRLRSPSTGLGPYRFVKRSYPTVSAATLNGPQFAKSQIPADSRIGETRAQAVRASPSEMGMTHADEPLTVEQVAQHFHRARRSDVQDLLETLAALGHVEATEDGAYAT